MAWPKNRLWMRWLLALAYAGVGVVHLHAPEAFLPIMPEWVPMPQTVIVATGWCELAGALGLVIPALQRAAGIGLALYAVAVFPANIKHALEGVDVAGLHLGWWYHLPRFALQPVLVWWALFCAGVIDWPWQAAANTSKHGC